MKLMNITIDIEGKTERDLESALEEAFRKIKDGNLCGNDCNDDGKYSFDVERQVRFIESDEISSEADHIAKQLPDVIIGDLQQQLVEFALATDGLNLDVFNEYIEGDIPSMIQVMINECGGRGNCGDDDVVEKLTNYFGLQSRLLTLRDHQLQAAHRAGM